MRDFIIVPGNLIPRITGMFVPDSVRKWKYQFGQGGNQGNSAEIIRYSDEE